MIPEAYWIFLGRWWWLMGVFALGGAAAAFFWASNASIEYRSEALLEMTYARDIDGVVTSNSGRRSQALNRLLLDLRSPEERERLQQELKQRGLQSGVYTNGSLDQPAKVNFTRSRGRSGPPYLAVVAKSQFPAEAQWLATEAADIVMERINSRQGLQAQDDTQYWVAEADRTAATLRETLAAQRAALAADSGLGGAATAELIEEHSRLLGELRLVLTDLQKEVSGMTEGDSEDSIAPTEILRLGSVLSELQNKVRTVGNLWERGLRAPLDVLYTLEAQPEYRFLRIREELLQARYTGQIRRLTSLSESLIRRPQIELVTTGDSPRRIQVLGLKKRYIIAFGGGGGLFVAWLLANLGENILVARARRRKAATA